MRDWGTALTPLRSRSGSLALLAAQPSLIGEPPPWRVTTELRAATRVLRATLALERAVADYRRAVFAVLHDEPGDDTDVPF